MSNNPKVSKAKFATQSIFLLCGLSLSSWAPMVPLAKERLGLNDSNLGLLLLLLGFGAIVMMPISGILSHRFGTRIVILLSGITVAIVLPLLLIMPNIFSMSAALLVFGAAVGTVDVAMNSHGVAVEHAYGKPIMSSLHGLFSVGGLFGAMGLGFLMKMGLPAMPASLTISAVLLGILSINYFKLLDPKAEKEQLSPQQANQTEHKPKTFSWLSGSVLFLGAACFAVFLSEGAMLDWSAIFLTENRSLDAELSGLGYASFSIAMAVMRLLGDQLVSKLSGKTVVIAGALVAAGGLALAVLTPYLVTALLGFALLGIGAANIVPVFFSEGSRLKTVPASVAIPAISTMGYAGQLAGPALLGFIAYRFSLGYAFLFIAMLLILLSASYALLKAKSKTSNVDQSAKR